MLLSYKIDFCIRYLIKLKMYQKIEALKVLLHIFIGTKCNNRKTRLGTIKHMYTKKIQKGRAWNYNILNHLHGLYSGSFQFKHVRYLNI